MKNQTQTLRAAVTLLIGWYAENKKALPWRIDPSPYRVWISETMLQQTRIEAAIPYYERFVRELPDVRALAAVDEERLMKLWEGLGYYSRARNLKKAAERVVTEFGGQFPSTAAQLKQLPGIGEYTAGAIASIAFGQPEPAVDGNVLRVILRLTACGDDILSQSTRKQVAHALAEVYPSGDDASALTEAIMELGETVCIPNGKPRCAVCPLQSLCLAYQRDATDRYPVKAAKKPRRIEHRTVLLLRCGDRIALTKRPAKGLLAGMWEFPGFEGSLTAQELRETLKQKGIELTAVAECGKARHVFSHVEWHMSGFTAECSTAEPVYSWYTAYEIRTTVALPSAFRYYVNLLW